MGAEPLGFLFLWVWGVPRPTTVGQWSRPWALNHWGFSVLHGDASHVTRVSRVCVFVFFSYDTWIEQRMLTTE
jgi:hypothetical protein